MGNGEDWRDAKAKADAQTARATMLKTYVDAGAISPAQMLNAAVDAKDLSADFLPQDDTEEGVISDNQKLVSGEQQSVVPVVTPLPSNVPQQQSSAPAMKAVGDAAALIDEELTEALKWARQASGG